MTSSRSDPQVLVDVAASDHDVPALVTVAVPADAAGPTLGASADGSPVACGLRSGDGHTLPAQLDATRSELTFVVPAGHAATRYGVTIGDPSADAPHPTTAVDRVDGVDLRVGGDLFASYIVSGTRRPYLWPVLGPSGATVVRGQGSVEHPHHTGLAVNYGGHSEGGSVNIWSDWDEPPYGPGGRMVHRGYREIAAGPVAGRVVHDVAYVDADGRSVAEETRTVSWWWASAEARVIDVECRIESITDAGPRPLVVMARVPAEMDVRRTGRITNSAGVDAPLPNGAHGTYRAAWADASGPSGSPPPRPPRDAPERLIDMGEHVEWPSDEPGTGPWHGIALIDHPDNAGSPNLVGAYAVAQQLTQTHYPPDDALDGPYVVRQRVLVHAGTAEDARVAAFADAFARPPDARLVQR